MYINILTHICKNDSPLAADRVMNTLLLTWQWLQARLDQMWHSCPDSQKRQLDLQLCMLTSYSFFNVKLVDSLKPITSLRFNC